MEGYRIHFACLYADVHECDLRKVITQNEWKSRNSFPRFQVERCQPIQNNQVEFSAEMVLSSA